MSREILEKALEAQLAGNLTLAKVLYMKAIHYGSKDPAAHANLGFILKEEGFLEKAAVETFKALKIDPTNTLFLANMGGICLELRSYKECIDYSKKALEKDPSSRIALKNLICAYTETGNIQHALEFKLRSLRLQPSNAINTTKAGEILLAQNKTDQALKASIDAIELDKYLADAYTLKARSLAALGETSEALNTFRHALKLEPNCCSALLGLSMSIKTMAEAAELIQLANNVSISKLEKVHAIPLHYSYANCFHKLKDFENAALHLKEAHKIKKLFMPSEADDICKKIKYFTETPFDTRDKVEADHRLSRIFIVGMPRCGSTLLESALSTNKAIKDLGETTALRHAVEIYLKNESADSLEFLYAKFSDNATNKSIKYTVDKQLYNFQLAELICKHLPNSKIIHCRRHPLDHILSMLRSYLGSGNNYTAVPIDCAKVLIQQEQAMNQFKEKFKQQVYTFSYDLFVSEPEHTLRPLIDWLGLEWESSYMHPELNKRCINTASVIQARRQINSESLGGWKNYKSLLDPARDLIEECGLFNDFELNT